MGQATGRCAVVAILWIACFVYLAIAMQPQANASSLAANGLWLEQTHEFEERSIADRRSTTWTLSSPDRRTIHAGGFGHTDHDDGQYEHCGPQCNTVAHLVFSSEGPLDVADRPEDRGLSNNPNYPELVKSPPKPNSA